MTAVKFQLVTRLAAWLLAAAACAPAATAGMSTPEPPRTPRMEAAPEELKNITVDEHLDGQLPLNLTFTDERNQPVRLGQYFTGKKPVVLQLGYYGCPMLCDLVSRGLTTSVGGRPSRRPHAGFWMPARTSVRGSSRSAYASPTSRTGE